MNLLDKTLVLKLNRSWQVIDEMTVGKAITFLHSESDGERPGFALDIETAIDENGNHVLVNAQPTAWEEWRKLPIREGDLYIGVGKNEHCLDGRIRVPLVVICANYDKVKMHRPKFSAAAIWERDKGICQYTGHKVTRENGNLDHVVPRDRGGRDEFSNLVVSKKDINTQKGNRLNHEVGLKLLNKPAEPPAVPPVVKIRQNVRHPVWVPFLKA